MRSKLRVNRPCRSETGTLALPARTSGTSSGSQARIAIRPPVIAESPSTVSGKRRRGTQPLTLSTLPVADRPCFTVSMETSRASCQAIEASSPLLRSRNSRLRSATAARADSVCARLACTAGSTSEGTPLRSAGNFASWNPAARISESSAQRPFFDAMAMMNPGRPSGTTSARFSRAAVSDATFSTGTVPSRKAR